MPGLFTVQFHAGSLPHAGLEFRNNARPLRNQESVPVASYSRVVCDAVLLLADILFYGSGQVLVAERLSHRRG